MVWLHGMHQDPPDGSLLRRLQRKLVGFNFPVAFFEVGFSCCLILMVLMYKAPYESQIRQPHVADITLAAYVSISVVVSSTHHAR